MEDKGRQVERVLEYIVRQYGVEPEFLWMNSPQDAAIRHPQSGKWFGVLLMEVPCTRLGLDRPGSVDLLDLKCDSLLLGSLIDHVHILPGYHMNKAHWLTVVLDGTIPLEKIDRLIDLSFDLTRPRKALRRHSGE